MAGYQCSCGYQTGDRSNFNRHLGACEVETRCGPREHSGRKPKVDDEDPFDLGTRGGPREHSGRKPRVDNDDPPDLRDLKAFYKALDEMVDLRVCAVCGEERGKQHFPAIKTYDPLNEIFIPMDSSAGVRSLILVDQDSGIKVFSQDDKVSLGKPAAVRLLRSGVWWCSEDVG